MAQAQAWHRHRRGIGTATAHPQPQAWPSAATGMAWWRGGGVAGWRGVVAGWLCHSRARLMARVAADKAIKRHKIRQKKP